MPSRQDAPAWIGLGSNLGDRLALLRFAAERLDRFDGVEIERASTVYETEPVGGPPGQPAFLNAVIGLRCSLGPHALLALLQEIEAAAGRRRSGVRDEPRRLDLDLLAWRDAVVRAPDLELPHPRLHLRGFVLEPLREVAPDWLHPVQRRTATELAEAVRGVSQVRSLGGGSLWPSSP